MQKMHLLSYVYVVSIGLSCFSPGLQAENGVIAQETAVLPTPAKNMVPSLSEVSAENKRIKNDTKFQLQSQAEIEKLNELYASFNLLVEVFKARVEHLIRVSQKLVPSRVRETRQWLDEMRQIANKLRSEQISPITPLKLKNLLFALKFVAGQVDKALDEGFYAVPSLTYDMVYIKNSPAGLTPVTTVDVEHMVTATSEVLHSMGTKADRCGLSWFNLLYGKISRLDRNYGISRFLLYSGATAAAIGTAYYCWAPRTWLPASLADHRDENTVKLENFWKFGSGAIATLGTLALLNKETGFMSAVNNTLTRIDATLRGDEFEQNEELYDDEDPITIDHASYNYMREKIKPLYPTVDYFMRPEVYDLTNTPVYRTIGLFGSPGNGKTRLAKAIWMSIKEKTGYDVAYVKYESEKFQSLKEAVQYMRDLRRPGVLFVDEVHNLGLQNERHAESLNAALEVLDEHKKRRDPILIILASNKPNLIDDALLRDGRMGYIIVLDNPSKEQRSDILATACAGYGIDKSNIDFDHFANLTSGVSVATLQKMVEHAVSMAKNKNVPVTFDQLYEAWQTVVCKLNKNNTLAAAERGVVAAYISGIALSYLLLPDSGLRLEAATIYSSQKKYVEEYDFYSKLTGSANELFHQEFGRCLTYSGNEWISDANSLFTAKMSPVPTFIKIQVAGLVAQQILFGNETTSRAKDRDKAVEIAWAYKARGVQRKNMSKKKQDDVQNQADALVEQCEQEIKTLLAAHKDKLEKLAQALAEKEFLRIDEIKALVGIDAAA